MRKRYWAIGILATAIRLSSGFADNLTSTLSLANLDEGTETQLTAQQLADLRPWAETSQTRLNALLEKLPSLAPAEARNQLLAGVKDVVLTSSGRKNETLMRYVLNRTLKVVAALDQSGSQPGVVDQQFAILLRSIKLSLKYYSSDAALLNGTAANGLLPHAQFGADFAEYLLGVNESTLNAQIQYQVGIFALGLLRHDLVSDALATTFAPAVALLTLQLDEFGNSLPSNDGDAVDRYRKIRRTFQRVVDAMKGTSVAVFDLKSVQALAVGGEHTCAVVSGSVWCWGSNKWGQLGDGTQNDSEKPVQAVGLSEVTAIAAGLDHTCAVARGLAYCWGMTFEKLDSTSVHWFGTTVPTPVPGLADVTAIAAGPDHTCAIAGKKAYCWGDNMNNQWPNPIDHYDLQKASAIPVEFFGGNDVRAIATSATHTCILNKDKVLCAGQSLEGELGKVTQGWSWKDKPVHPSGIGSVQAINETGMQTCVLSQGAIYCWGNGNANPEKVADATMNAASSAGIAIGYHCTNVNGIMMCWDENHYRGSVSNSSWQMREGQLAVLGNVQALVLGIGRVSIVATGGERSCAVVDLASGYQQIYCWYGKQNPRLVEAMNHLAPVAYVPAGATVATNEDPRGKCYQSVRAIDGRIYRLDKCIDDGERKALGLPKGVYTEQEAIEASKKGDWETGYYTHPVKSRLKCVASMGLAPGCPPPN